MEQLEALIKQGIIWEDEFVKEYLAVLKDNEYMEFFGEDKEEAEKLLDTMVKESTEHKQILENLFGEL